MSLWTLIYFLFKSTFERTFNFQIKVKWHCIRCYILINPQKVAEMMRKVRSYVSNLYTIYRRIDWWGLMLRPCNQYAFARATNVSSFLTRWRGHGVQRTADDASEAVCGHVAADLDCVRISRKRASYSSLDVSVRCCTRWCWRWMCPKEAWYIAGLGWGSYIQ